MIEDRLLPALISANDNARKQNKRAICNMPTIGCGQFAGKFLIKDKTGPAKAFTNALDAMLTKHHDKLGNIALIHLAAHENEIAALDSTHKGASNDKTKTYGNTKFRIRPWNRDEIPQLSQAKDYEEFGDDFSKCCRSKIVAADHVSWPGNDAYIGWRSTDEGLVGGATNVIGIMTGIQGTYDNEGINESQPLYIHPENNQWASVIEESNLTIKANDSNINILKNDGDYLNIKEYPIRRERAAAIEAVKTISEFYINQKDKEGPQDDENVRKALVLIDGIGNKDPSGALLKNILNEGITYGALNLNDLTNTKEVINGQADKNNQFYQSNTTWGNRVWKSANYDSSKILDKAFQETAENMQVVEGRGEGKDTPSPSIPAVDQNTDKMKELFAGFNVVKYQDRDRTFNTYISLKEGNDQEDKENLEELSKRLAELGIKGGSGSRKHVMNHEVYSAETYNQLGIILTPDNVTKLANLEVTNLSLKECKNGVQTQQIRKIINSQQTSTGNPRGFSSFFVSPSIGTTEMKKISDAIEQGKTEANPNIYKGLGITGNFQKGEGFTIGKIVKDSIADKMGLEEGSIITHLNGKDIKALDEINLLNKLRNAGKGTLTGAFSITLQDEEGQSLVKKGKRTRDNLLITGDQVSSARIVKKSLMQRFR